MIFSVVWAYLLAAFEKAQLPSAKIWSTNSTWDYVPPYK